MSDNIGLHEKYTIGKVDGTDIDPDAKYFVLRLDTDLAARKALLVYAWTCNNETLAGDIINLLRIVEET